MSDTTLRARVAPRELEAVGPSLDDRLAIDGREARPRPEAKTVAEYVPVVAARYQPRSRRTHGSYWRPCHDGRGRAPELYSAA
jgi:hypothetical protein